MKNLIYISLFLLPMMGNAQSYKEQTLNGNLAYTEDNFKSADSLYMIALESNENYLPAKYNRGLSTYKLSKWEESLKIWNELSQSEVDSIRSHSFYHKGNCQLMLWIQMEADVQNLSLKIDDLDLNAISDIEKKMEAYLVRDTLLTQRGNLLKSKAKTLEASIEDYKNCLRVDPKDEDARYNLIYSMALRPIKKQNAPSEKGDSSQKNAPNENVIESQKKAISLIEDNKFDAALRELKQTKEKFPNESSNLDGLIQKLEVINEILNK